MIRGLLSILVSGFVFVSASAQVVDACQTTEAECVLDAAWSAALELPEEKQQRLSSVFLEVANLTEDSALADKWASRFGVAASVGENVYPDFGWQSAELR